MDSYLLNEDGTYLLQEDGYKILLETERIRYFGPDIVLVRARI